MVSDIDDKAVIEYQNMRLKEKAAPKTINEEVGFLLRMLEDQGDFIRAKMKRRKTLKLEVGPSVAVAYSEDPNCWRTFANAIDLLDRRRAFGIGLVLPSPQQVEALPAFNLIPDLIAFDGDAKRSPQASPYHVPTHISDYVRSAQSYSEFSTSLKGLRALIFGDLPLSNTLRNHSAMEQS